MKQQHPVRTIPLGVVTGFSALILAVGGATAWWTLNHTQPNFPQAQKPTSVVEPISPTSPAAAVDKEANIYWLQPNNSKVKLAPNATAVAPADTTPNAVLEKALNRLLAGPADPAVTTTIPKGTTLKTLEVKPDGIHIDLSAEFASGGGSASMQGRIAQVLYTATSLDPSAKVWLSVDGKPLESLGGEGLLLEQPMTRQNFDQNFSL